MEREHTKGFQLSVVSLFREGVWIHACSVFPYVVCALQVLFDMYQILHSTFKNELKHYH